MIKETYTLSTIACDDKMWHGNFSQDRAKLCKVRFWNCENCWEHFHPWFDQLMQATSIGDVEFFLDMASGGVRVD